MEKDGTAIQKEETQCQKAGNMGRTLVQIGERAVKTEIEIGRGGDEGRECLTYDL